jgi:hypothetical protein
MLTTGTCIHIKFTLYYASTFKPQTQAVPSWTMHGHILPNSMALH